MNTFDPNELIDPSWVRQRGPIERNILIRSNKFVEPVTFAQPKASRTIAHILIMLVFSSMFGFSLTAVYNMALERTPYHFNHLNTEH